MRTTSIGDRTITAIGCGDVSLAIAASRGVDRREVERTLSQAIELGITLVDVHPEDDAERLAGEVVRAQRARDRVVVATSIFVQPAPLYIPMRDKLPLRLPPRYIQDRVENALRCTRLDALPLVQLPLAPEWTTAPAWPEVAGTAARLVREGKVLAWGARIDVEDIDDAAALIAEPWLSSLSVDFHLYLRDAERLLDRLRDLPAGPIAPRPAATLVATDLFAAVTPPAATPPALRAIPIFARTPLDGGALSGDLGPGVKLSLRDDRTDLLEPGTLDAIAVRVARLAPFVRERPPAATSCERARAVLERTKRPEHLECVTVAELALRYVIDRGAIALPRLHRHMVLPDAISAMVSPPLSPELTERIRDAVSE